MIPLQQNHAGIRHALFARDGLNFETVKWRSAQAGIFSILLSFYCNRIFVIVNVRTCHRFLMVCAKYIISGTDFLELKFRGCHKRVVRVIDDKARSAARCLLDVLALDVVDLHLLVCASL